MLDYIYVGEVKVMQDHLEQFLEVANKFKLNGLLGSDKDTSTTENVNQCVKEEDLIQEPPMMKVRNPGYIAKSKEKALGVLQKPSDLKDVRNVDVKQLYQELIVKEDGTFRCSICGRTMAHKANMERHVETHMTGLTYECKHCFNIFRSRESLKNHNKKPCNNRN